MTEGREDRLSLRPRLRLVSTNDAPTAVAVDWGMLATTYVRRFPEAPACRGLANIALHALADALGADEAAAFADKIAANLRNPPGAA